MIYKNWIYKRMIQCGEERKQREFKKWTVPPVKIVIFQRPVVELCKKLDR